MIIAGGVVLVLLFVSILTYYSLSSGRLGSTESEYDCSDGTCKRVKKSCGCS